MEIGYTPEQEAMRPELRAYYEKLLDAGRPSAELARSRTRIGEAPRRVWKQMCADGWAGIGWPKEYGGQGRDGDRAVHLLRRVDARRRTGADAHASTPSGRRSCASAPTSRRSSSSRRSSPATSTSASATRSPAPAPTSRRCRRVPCTTATSYVINGQKMWTSLSSDADYCWLAVRTDPEAAKHKGISMIIVPMDTPGITMQPLNLLGEPRHQRGVLRRRRRARGQRRRRREPRLEAHHQPAQPRARHALRERRDGAGPQRGHRVRAEHEAARRSPGHRPGVGAAQPRQVPREGRDRAAHELAGGVGGDAGRRSTSATAPR